MIKAVLFDEPLEDVEVWRINRAQMALLLKKIPEEVDRMPYLDFAEVQQVADANHELNRRIR